MSRRLRELRLTPLKSLELLMLIGKHGQPVTEWQVNQVRDALVSNVRHGLAGKRRSS